MMLPFLSDLHSRILVYWVTAKGYIRWQDWTILRGRIEYNQQVTTPAWDYLVMVRRALRPLLNYKDT
jgi:hypothetical protein